MSTQITCPVCDRSAIEIDVCSNCQTDLASIRMLTELPIFEPASVKNRWVNWQIGLLFISILLNFGLGICILR